MNSETNATTTKPPTSAALLTRFDALPARQMQLFGKLCIAHVVAGEQFRQSAGMPPDPIVLIMESLMVSVEPKS